MYRPLRDLFRFQAPADIDSQSANRSFYFEADPDVDALVINRSATTEPGFPPEFGIISLVGPLVRLSLPPSLSN